MDGQRERLSRHTGRYAISPGETPAGEIIAVRVVRGSLRKATQECAQISFQNEFQFVVVPIRKGNRVVRRNPSV